MNFTKEKIMKVQTCERVVYLYNSTLRIGCSKIVMVKNIFSDTVVHPDETYQNGHGRVASRLHKTTEPKRGLM